MMVIAEKVLITVVSAVLNAITVMGTWKGLWDVLGNILGVVAWIIKTEVVAAFTVARFEIELIIGVIERVVGFFQRVIDTVKQVIEWLGKIKVPDIKLPFGIGGPAGRATGGPVVPGQIYKVNENTPNSEFFSPAVPGNIIPAGASGAGPAMPAGVHLEFNNANVDPWQVSREVAWVMRK
jgi:hypothetical protein